jgi:hypothetical protein
MLNLRNRARLAVPVAAAIVAAAAVGGPALAASASKSSAHASATKTIRGKTGKTGKTGPRGLQGPQGPAGAGGSAGAQGAAGTSGTAAGGGAEATILYAANKPAATTNPPAPTPTAIYVGHGLALTATCTAANGLGLALQTGAGDAITVNSTQHSPTAAVTTTLNDYSGDLKAGVNTVLFASTDGAVLQLQFQESTSQTGADCYVYGTRIGG